MAQRLKSGGWTAPRKGGYSATTGGRTQAAKDGSSVKPAPPKGRGAASSPSPQGAR